jgi:branched-chain amino acid transport system ATP-binding protein
VLVEQNVRVALAGSHRGGVMATWRIALEGTAQDLLGDSQVRDAYLGGRRAG